MELTSVLRDNLVYEERASLLELARNWYCMSTGSRVRLALKMLLGEDASGGEAVIYSTNAKVCALPRTPSIYHLLN